MLKLFTKKEDSMQNKTLRPVLIVFVAIVLSVCVFGSGFVVGNFVPVLKNASVAALPLTPNSNQGGTPADLQSQFAPFWQAWDLVHQHYVDQPVDDTKLVQGALNGMMNALGDPHTGYSNPLETTDLNNSMQGAFDGIGAYVDTRGAYLTITATMPGFPAALAGLLPGDQIIAVDGQDMTGINPDIVRMTKVMGAAGTEVHLTIQRLDVEKPLEFTLTRAHIVIPSVTSKMLDNKIAYIQVNQFGDSTVTDFHSQLSQLMAQNPAGMVLDLRNNPGGYLEAGIAVASEFIDHGDIVSEQTSDGTKIPYAANPGGLATTIPLVVLVNGNSASASEIVAGAIQDIGRGKLVGELTYGKGSVQQYYPLSDGGLARITIAKWLTPSGRTIDKKGLTPDQVVPMTPDDIAKERDPQLNQAVKSLINMDAEKNALNLDAITTLLPEFPPSRVDLTYDLNTGFLYTPEGTIAYDLDATRNQWRPYLSDKLAQSLPNGYGMFDNNGKWILRSSDGQDLFVWNATSLNWEAVEVIPSTATTKSDSTPVEVSCPLALPARLEVGISALTTGNLNLRSSPGTVSSILKTIPVNLQVKISGGPVCVPDGYGAHLWWEVILPNGSTGWSAEGSYVGKNYFLEPVK
jgi:carboxyl-terminal processing protease